MKKFYTIAVKRLRRLFLLNFTLILTANSIYAGSKVWSYTGATGVWSTGSNWVGGIAPVNGDDVTIGNTATYTFSNVPSLSLNSLTIGSSADVTISSTGATLVIASLNLTGNDLTVGSLVDLDVANGNIASGKTLLINSLRSLTISGTLTVAGSIVNSGTITVNSLLNFTGSSPVAPNNVVVSPGGEIRFSGSGSVTGLGNSTINGLGTFAGTTGTASGFIASWGPGSTLQYAGTSQQTANYFEFPANSPTNVTINNSAGVKFNTLAPPNPVITGTLTLAAGVLTLGNSSSYPYLTFQNGDVPIVRTGGSIDPGFPSTATLVFGKTGNTGGSAFTLPDNLFSAHTAIYRLNVERLNPLTLNNQDITVNTFCSLYHGLVILGSGDLTINATSVGGSFDENTMFVTSSASGHLAHTFSVNSGSAFFTYPIGEIAGAATYTGFIFTMNSVEAADKTVGFKVVDDICNPNIGAASNYTTRYYGTAITGAGSYNYSLSLPFLASASSDCSGGGGDVVGATGNMQAAFYNLSNWVAAGIVSGPFLDISNANPSTAPLGYDILGIDGAIGTVAVNSIVAQEEGVSIYPNPAKNQFTVYGLQVTNSAAFEIYNMLGEKMHSAQFQIVNRKSEIPIDISSLNEGVYFLQVKTGDGLVTKRFVKQ